MRLRSGDRHHLRKSADRKAQIRKAFVAVTGLICAFRSADFLRWCCVPPKKNLFLAVHNTPNLGGQMGNAIQRPKEQTSFDRKEGKAESTCVNERGSHPTSPHPQTSWASTQRVPHMERPYFQCIYRLCPNEWDPACMRRLDGTIRSPAMKRINTAVIRPPMEYACAVWSGGPTGCLQRLQDSFAKRHSLSLPPLEKRFEYHTLVLFHRVRANLAPTYLSSLVPPLTSTKSGYSFRNESYLVPPYKKSLQR